MKNILKQKMVFPAFMQVFRMGGGAQPVSNFPSIVAKFIVTEMFIQWMLLHDGFPNDIYTIIDGSSGWAGRLTGVLGSYTQLRYNYKALTGRELTICYITTDPNVKVDYRFKLIVEDWFTRIEPTVDSQYFKFNKNTVGSETLEFYTFCKEVMTQNGVFGGQLSLTSPPYFDREKYSTDEAQSWKQFPTYERWRDGFLDRTIHNIYNLLLPGGRFYFNIANLKDGTLVHPLESDSLKFAEQYGFHCMNTYKMLLSSRGKGSINQVIVNEKTKKFEPIFVLEKP